VNALLTATTADLVELSSGARAGEPSRCDPVDAFGLAAWSGVASDGDAAAGACRRALGPAASLRLVMESVAARRSESDAGALGARMVAAGVPDVERLELHRALSRWAPRVEAGTVRGWFRSATALGVRVVVPGDASWPASLDDLGDHAPPALWVRGGGRLPERGVGVAVVGARAATSYGEQVAADLSSGLSDRGLVVVSGGAYGVDGMAHRAAVASGASTIAVMAGGVDRFYPAGHDDLLRAVLRDGLMVSESPCGTMPHRFRFLSRNRLIAALSEVVVVVEAGRRSGSLNTAGHAHALGRPVGVVPGPVTSPLSAGCHALLRSGLGSCVTGVPDVVELLGGQDDLVERSWQVEESVDVGRVSDALSARVERSTDEVAAASGLSVATVRTVLAEMEADALVERGPAGWRRRRETRRG
jgi:DNA processing protein